MKGGVEASAIQQDSKGIRSGLYTQRSESRDRGFGGVTPKDRPRISSLPISIVGAGILRDKSFSFYRTPLHCKLASRRGSER